MSDLFRQLSSQNRALAALDTTARNRVGPTITEAFNTLTPYLRVVVANNPGLTPIQVLARQDVVAQLDRTFEALLAQLQLQIDDAATAARVLALNAARAQLENLDMPLAGTPAVLDSGYLADVKARLAVAMRETRIDLHDTIVAAIERVPVPPSYHEDATRGVVNVPQAHGAARGAAVPDAVNSVLADLALRGQLGVSAATQRAYSEASADAYRMAGTQHDAELGKMWVANYANGHVPCPSCAALSGQVARLDTEFFIPRWVKRTFKLFGQLMGPPAHPNCQCKIVPCVLQASPPPSTVRPTVIQVAPADTELQEAATVTPVPLPALVSASDIRAMTPSTFVKLLAALLTLLANLLRKYHG